MRASCGHRKCCFNAPWASSVNGANPRTVIFLSGGGGAEGALIPLEFGQPKMDQTLECSARCV